MNTEARKMNIKPPKSVFIRRPSVFICVARLCGESFSCPGIGHPAAVELVARKPQEGYSYFKMNVFLSYTQSDQVFAEKLRSALVSAGLSVWDISHEVLPGDNWAMKTGQALEKSDAMIVLLSPDAVKSRSVRSEIEYALGSPRYERRLIPVVVKPTRGIPWILEKLPIQKSSVRPKETAKNIIRLLKLPSAAQARARV
jgi:hypothetical protein